MSERFDPNSMCLWWPKIIDLGIPVPKTTIAQTPDECPDLLNQWMWAAIGESDEGIPSGWGVWFQRVQELADSIGYPLFVRTDLFSGKHGWNRTCYVPAADGLERHLLWIVHDGELASFIGMRHRAVVLREYLLLDPPFRAFEGMPVARERRYFVRDGEVICHHPYWIADAMRWYAGTPKPRDWERDLAALNEERAAEVKLLTEYATRVAAIMDGYWSVDFACAHDGTWYLIDMARGENSWHPDHAD